MNEIVVWSYGVCIAVILCVIINALCPARSMKKTVNFITALFLMVCILVSAENIAKADFSEIFQNTSGKNTSDFQNTAQNKMLSCAKENIESIAAKTLYEKGIEYKNIDAVMDIDENGCINIDRITIKVSDAQYALSAKEAIENELSIKAEVVIDD